MTEAQTVTRTLASGLKEIGVIEKRMRANIELIKKYSSMVSNFKPYFESEEAQTRKVAGLIQANRDLFKEAVGLKMKLEKTNQDTKVVINGNTYTIAELLFIKHTSQQVSDDRNQYQQHGRQKQKVKGVGNLLYQTFLALDETAANERLNDLNRRDDGKGSSIVRFYDEEDKLKHIREWEDLINKITTELESINATTPIV